MSQIENKMDDFAPFGGTARTEYQEDELAIPHVVSTAVINALDDIMFPHGRAEGEAFGLPDVFRRAAYVWWRGKTRLFPVGRGWPSQLRRPD